MYKEAKLQTALKHQNVLKISAFIKRSTWHEANGLESKVGAIVSELAPRGPMFDILQGTGPLDQKFTRYYAQQLIQAVHYIHC